MRPATDNLADFIGGFVATEGCFTGHGKRRFRFNVGLGASDDGMCELIRAVFGVGYLTRSTRRKPYHDDEVQFWEHGFRRRKTCIVDDCNAPAKAYGYCRKHLWQYRRE